MDRDIKNRVRKYRQIAGLTMEELGEIVNVSTPTMSHIELGRTKTRGVTMLRLAQYFEVPVECLFALRGSDYMAIPEER